METTYGYSDDDYVAIGEAARILGLSTSTIRRYIDAGQLSPGRTPGGHYRFLIADLRGLIRSEAGAA